MMRELVKCPHCGYTFRTDVKAIEANGETTAVRGILHRKPKHRRVTSIDLECPHCGKTFVHEVES
jgi:uncharacterized C2H2 Zn-finger protein